MLLQDLAGDGWAFFSVHTGSLSFLSSGNLGAAFLHKIIIESLTSSRHLEQPFASPNPDDTHFVLVMPVYDAKRRIDDFAQLLHVELRDDPAAQRVKCQALDLCDDFGNKPLSDIGRALCRVISLQVLKVFDRRCSKRYPRRFSHTIISRQDAFLHLRGKSRGLLPGPSSPLPLPA